MLIVGGGEGEGDEEEEVEEEGGRSGGSGDLQSLHGIHNSADNGRARHGEWEALVYYISHLRLLLD